MKTKQVKVTIDENLYKLLCRKSVDELGEVNLSLFTRILYNKHVKKSKSLLFKEEITKLRSKGLTYGEIGEIFGMSRQAVHQKLQNKKEGL